MSVSARLAELRGEADLSQTEFAVRVGTSKSALATYEKGLRETPLSVASAACKEFDVNPTWLLFGTGSKHTADASELAVRAYRVTRNFVKETPVEWTDEMESEFFLLSLRYLTEHTNASDEFLNFMLGKAAANAR
ncbi:MAG: helix-turn-helix transcriptional regulator [Pseudomonadota bacterium]